MRRSQLPMRFECRLLDCRRHLMQPARMLEQLTRAGAIRRANKAVTLHQVYQMRGAAITNTQASL